MFGYHYNKPIQDPDHPEPQKQAPVSDDLSCSHDSISGNLETTYPAEQMEDM